MDSEQIKQIRKEYMRDYMRKYNETKYKHLPALTPEEKKTNLKQSHAKYYIKNKDALLLKQKEKNKLKQIIKLKEKLKLLET